MKTGSNNSLLHLAASRGYLQLANLLIEQGIEINAQNNDGDTPLHLAAWEGHVEMARHLLEKGAILNVYNNNGLTAMDSITQELSLLKEGGSVS
ncbi:MAG: ankyrin repeat domain-containing protein [Candidatus Amoebophilus sp.]